MLTDAGPLVGLLDKADQHHAAAQAVLRNNPEVKLVTPCPSLTEAMQLLSRHPYAQAQKQLAGMVERGELLIHYPRPAELLRILALMERYADRPMSYADAALIAAAETRKETRIFTFDSDFRFYRLANGAFLETLP